MENVDSSLDVPELVPLAMPQQENGRRPLRRYDGARDNVDPPSPVEDLMIEREMRLLRELGNVGERQNDHDHDYVPRNSRSLERPPESNGSARFRSLRRPDPRLQLPNSSRGGQAIANPAPRIVDPDVPRLFRRRWYRPVLPFQSVLDIFNACLHLEQVEIVTTSAETDILRQNLGEIFDIQNPDPPLDVIDL